MGKVLPRLLLNGFMEDICTTVIPESQSDFISGRGTTDILSARQIQEKCIEQRFPLDQVFVDMTKAFDTVNRWALWKIGCSPKFIYMKARLSLMEDYPMKSQLIMNAERYPGSHIVLNVFCCDIGLCITGLCKGYSIAN